MASQQSLNEVCPNCGEFVAELVEYTGWCSDCSPSTELYTPAEIFLLRNADHIEHYMLSGKTLFQAIDLLRHELRRYRTCACCGAFIERGNPNSIFCRKTAKCRSIVRRYEYLYHRKGLPKATALAMVLENINGSE